MTWRREPDTFYLFQETINQAPIKYFLLRSHKTFILIWACIVLVDMDPDNFKLGLNVFVQCELSAHIFDLLPLPSIKRINVHILDRSKSEKTWHKIRYL